MKLLENIGLVQFFLYEREDLEVGLNTAFLGPNGTGKTALLDALQTVMLAADANRTHFNASGEGKKRARTLRDYCLGVYGQNSDARCRPSANTYINLVFRDEETDVPVTAGVSLSASEDSPDITFNSLYILPGVALATNAHVERQSGKEVVLPWRSFQHVAADLCRMEGQGATPYFTTNREEFTRRLLIEHLAAPGDKPNVQALRSAFARSLKLNQDVHDLSETLRQHLIEPRPTNVREFRSRLDQFRDVRDLIKRLKARIEQAAEVEGKYSIVQRERTSQANLECLKAVYQTERLGETIGDAEVAIENQETELNQAQLDHARATSDAGLANEARDRALTALNRDPEYRKQAGQAERLSDLDTDLERKQAALRNVLGAMTTAAVAAGCMAEMADQRGAFEDAIRQIEDLETARAAGTVPQPAVIQSALKAVANAHDLVRRALADAESDQKVARAKKREAEMTLERAGRGLAPLRDATQALQRVLSEANIETQPICDLVSIADQEWQSIIEAYLGPHVDALLVPKGREIDAINAYRGLKGQSRIYGVKLALPSRLREWRAQGDGPFAAELIRGTNPDAVRYLQGELGRTRLAQSSEQIRDGDKALTTEGMISSGGGVDRRRLPGPDELKIGRVNSGAMRQAAERELSECTARMKTVGDMVDRLAGAQAALAPFANAHASQAAMEEQFVDVRNTRALAEDLRNTLVESQTDDLEALQVAKTIADEQASAARRKEVEAGKAVATLEERLKSTRSQLEALLQQQKLVGAEEHATRQHPLYNPNEVERHRSKYDERFGDDWQEKNAACVAAITRARSTADNADREAWSLFTTYATNYHKQNVDFGSQDWVRASQFIQGERKHLQDMELAEQEKKSEEAYEAAVKVFRTDVAQALLAGFDRVDEQMDGLNHVLKVAPEFSNNERYQFRRHVVEQHRALYDFLRRVREQGGDEEDIFGGAGKVPDEFRALVEGDGNSELLNETSPLNDHRRFFSYDVEIFQDGKSIGWLSKRLGPGSGGEHRTPLYVIFGAALAAAYGKANGNTRGGGIMLLDEAFEKMDPQNVRATADYLNALGLQLIMAGPETDQPKMSSFLNVYYDMARFGSRTIQLTKNTLSDKARELLMSDNYLTHPELLEAEVSRFREVEEVANVAG